jgi:hypothetical protein
VFPLPPHDEKPELHVPPQMPAVHVGVMFAVEQTTPCGLDPVAEQPPQLLMSVWVLTSHPFVATPSQSANPLLQVKPHVPPVQVDVALARVGHVDGSVHVVEAGAQPALPHAKVELALVPLGQTQPAGFGLPAGYWTKPPVGVVPPVPNPKFRFPAWLSRRKPVLIAAPYAVLDTDSSAGAAAEAMHPYCSTTETFPVEANASPV